jgi:glutamine synthetase
MLEAGLDGIRNKMEPPAPVGDDVYEYSSEELVKHGINTLPGTLSASLDELAKDDVVRGALGEHVFDVFHRAKSTEWEEYRLQVTGWEQERYLETV